jgi:DMSO reductase anchor subunit
MTNLFVLIFLSYFVCFVVDVFLIVKAQKAEPQQLTIAEVLMLILFLIGNFVGTIFLFLLSTHNEKVQSWLNLIIYRPKSQGK